MEERAHFTMSGKTIDLLREEVVNILHRRYNEINEQTGVELINLAEALTTEAGFSVSFEFHYNS